MVVYETDLAFDRLLRIGYISGDVETIKSDDRFDPDTMAEVPHEPGCMPLQKSRARFSWDRPQPHLCRGFSESCEAWDWTHERTYAIFRDSYDTIIPLHQWEDYGSPTAKLYKLPRTCTHRTIVSWFGALHKSIFAVAYGYDIEFRKSAKPKEVVVFCADLLRLAEHYGMTDLVLKRLQKYILAVEDIWQLVSGQPVLFMMFGYHIRSTELFRDARNNAIGLNIIPSPTSSEAIVSENDYTAWIPEEVFELAQIGCATFLNEFAKLCNALRKVTDTSFYKRQCGIFYEQAKLGRSEGPVMIACLLMGSTIEDNIHSRWNAIPSIFPGGGYEQLRAFYELCKASDMVGLISRSSGIQLGLKLILRDAAQVMAVCKDIMAEITAAFQQSVFFGAGSDYGCWYDGTSHVTAADCELPSRRARFTSEFHATYLEVPCDGRCLVEDKHFQHSWRSIPGYPSHRKCSCEWPVPIWTEGHQRVEGEVIEEKPTSLEYFETLGLVFPARNKRKKASQLPWWGSLPRS